MRLLGNRWPRLDRQGQPRRRPCLRPETSPLEPKVLLSAVDLLGASTADSRGITVEYRVNAAGDGATDPPVFAVSRSAEGGLDAGSQTVIPALQAPRFDDAGNLSGAPGVHTVTVPLPSPLTVEPKLPYVVVSAATAAPGASSASFRTYSLAVVSHGGIQNPSWKKGPPWELVLAKLLKAQGYDAVIPFNWAAKSSQPGAAAKEGVHLASTLKTQVAQFPADAPLDVHLIGHSEGTVIITQALARLGPPADFPENLREGFGALKLTLLDPHAANTGVRGQQYSVQQGPIGWITKGVIDNYQSRAHDPPVVVPSWVTQTEVFYQHTPVSRAHGTNDGIYNLWGQVPVHGAATYFDLTPSGATHSGKSGVVYWYQDHVVPTLGEGSPAITADEVTGGLAGGGKVASSARPTFAGRSEPGSTVRLFAAPAPDPDALALVGTATAGPDGRWSLITRSLTGGTYRFVATAFAPRPRPLAMIPVAPIGLVRIQPR